MYNKSNTKELIDRFEVMLANNERYFFDVDQFEEIAEHYYLMGDYKQAINVLEIAQEQHPQSSTFALLRAHYLVDMNNLI